MSVLDQLGNITDGAQSSAANSINGTLNGALGGVIGGALSSALGISIGANSNFFKPLDVQASVLFANLSTTLNLKGNSLSTDENSTKYSIGFTPDVDFIIDPTNVDNNTQSPVERGILLKGGILNNNGTTLYGTLRNTNDILNTDIPGAYDAFDDEGGEEFLHRLDQNQIPIGSSLNNSNDIYLSSFVQSSLDNEDPISFGYDIIIGYDNSPLFNGAIEDFITKFSSYSEISS